MDMLIDYRDSELGDLDDVELVDADLMCEVEASLIRTVQRNTGKVQVDPRWVPVPTTVYPMYHNSFQRRRFGCLVEAVQHRRVEMNEFMIVNNGNDHGQVGHLGSSIFHTEREALLQGLEELDAELRMFQRIRGEVLYRLKKLEEEQAIKGEQHAQAEAGY